MKSFLVSFTLFLLLLISCDADMGSIEGIKVGALFNVKLTEIKKVENSAALIDQVQPYFNDELSYLNQIRVYSVNAELRESNIQPAQVVLLNLNVAELQGAQLALLITGKQVQHVRLFGHQDIDQDPFAQYENFYRQFGRNITIPDPDKILSDSVIIELSSNLNDQSKYLFDHARRMYNKNFLIRHTMAMTSADKTPPAEWYRQQQNEFQLLAFQIDFIKDIIGEEAVAAYKEAANQTIEALNPVIDNIETSPDPSYVRERIIKVRNENRRSCHTIKLSNADRGLKGFLESIMGSYGHRRDLFRVDIDVWAIPAKNEQSQEIANAIRATTVYMSFMNKE